MVSSINFISAFASTGKELQNEADKMRERGKSLVSIDLYNQAIVQYQETKDYPNMLGALTGRLLAWKHIYYQTEDKIYAIFVKNEAETLLDIAQEYHLLSQMHLIHFLKATSAILLKDYSSAETEFTKAVQLYPTDHAEKGDWIAHLGDAIYRNGKKEEGKKTVLQGVEIIKERASQIDSFLFNVWVSGAYLRLAKLLKVDNPPESQLFLNQAKNIIESDSRLVIRKQQLEAFQNNRGDY